MNPHRLRIYTLSSPRERGREGEREGQIEKEKEKVKEGQRDRERGGEVAVCLWKQERYDTDLSPVDRVRLLPCPRGEYQSQCVSGISGGRLSSSRGHMSRGDPIRGEGEGRETAQEPRYPRSSIYEMA
jgi:hypothetical protein